MEGRVFVCTWRKVGSRYRLWVKRRPAIAVEARSFDEADEELYGAIMVATGDGENAREYDPPPPTGDFTGSGLLLRLAMVSGQGLAHVANPEALFTRDYCPQCRSARGKRTGASMLLDRIESGYEGGSTYAGVAPMALHAPRVGRQYFSAEFLRLLRPRERDSFEWREVERTRKGKTFFELVSTSATVPFAAFKPQYCYVELLKCDTCGGTPPPRYWFDQRTPMWYVSELDVPSPLPSCFAVGPAPGDLCFRRERWREIVGRAGTRGIKSYDVGVVDHRLVQRRPKYVLRSTVH